MMEVSESLVPVSSPLTRIPVNTPIKLIGSPSWTMVYPYFDWSLVPLLELTDIFLHLLRNTTHDQLYTKSVLNLSVSI